MTAVTWDREAWIAERTALVASWGRANPEVPDVECPTPEKEAAVLVEARKAIAGGETYIQASVLGYRAYKTTEKACGWIAHGFWVGTFLASHGLVRKPYDTSLLWLSEEVVAP